MVGNEIWAFSSCKGYREYDSGLLALTIATNVRLGQLCQGPLIDASYPYWLHRSDKAELGIYLEVASTFLLGPLYLCAVRTPSERYHIYIAMALTLLYP